MKVATMTSGLNRTLIRSLSLLALAVSIVVLAGCAATGPSTPSSDALAEVVGTWTYKTSGTQPLSRGTLQLATKDGRLMGQLRDSELGTIPLDAQVSGERLELRMDVFRVGPLSIAGSVEGNEFRGLVDRPAYNVTMSADTRSWYQSQNMYGSFRAERRGAPATPNFVLNCPKLGPDGIQACQ